MTFLFDIGNVLLAFDFEPAIHKLMGKSADPEAFEKIIAAKDPFEAGEISQDTAVKLMREYLDFDGSNAEFFNAWNSIFTPVKKNFQLAKKLRKQGHRLILFSNINPIHASYCIREYQLLEHFDHAVFSYEIGTIKPNHSFFTRAFEQFDIMPKETIYIDDLPENIAAGKRHGLRSFCYDYRRHDDLLRWLETQNIQTQ